MNNALRNNLIVAGMGLMVLGTAAIANAADSKPQLAVCVHNYVGVPSSTLKRAEHIAETIFAHAGVETIWMEIAPGDNASMCATTITRVEVSWVDHANFNLSSDVLGLAPGSDNEINRKTVYVFDQVANRVIQKQNIVDKSELLGHAMSHEIGHILTNSNKHSVTGLMRARWQREDFYGMTQGHLNFSSDQAAKIREEVTRRHREQAVSQLAASAN